MSGAVIHAADEAVARDFVVTANALLTGDIVFRTAAEEQSEGGWSLQAGEAARFDAKAADAAAASARADLVVGAQPARLADAAASTDAAGRFAHIRDQIRADGPTVPYGRDARR